MLAPGKPLQDPRSRGKDCGAESSQPTEPGSGPLPVGVAPPRAEAQGPQTLLWTLQASVRGEPWLHPPCLRPGSCPTSCRPRGLAAVSLHDSSAPSPAPQAEVSSPAGQGADGPPQGCGQHGATCRGSPPPPVPTQRPRGGAKRKCKPLSPSSGTTPAPISPLWCCFLCRNEAHSVS